MRRLWGCAVAAALITVSVSTLPASAGFWQRVTYPGAIGAAAADPATGQLLTLSQSGGWVGGRGPGASWELETFRTYAPSTFTYGQALVVDERARVAYALVAVLEGNSSHGSGEWVLVAIDLHSRVVKWTESPGFSPAFLSGLSSNLLLRPRGGVLVVGRRWNGHDYQPAVAAVNASGDIDWTSQDTAVATAPSSAAIAPDGLTLVVVGAGNDAGYALGFDLSSGKELWRLATTTGLYLAAAGAGGLGLDITTVYVVGMPQNVAGGARLTALDASTGTALWSATLSRGTARLPDVVPSSLVSTRAGPCVGGYLEGDRPNHIPALPDDGFVWCVSTTGQTRWTNMSIGGGVQQLAAGSADVLVGALQMQSRTPTMSGIQQRLVLTRLTQASGQPIDTDTKEIATSQVQPRVVAVVEVVGTAHYLVDIPEPGQQGNWKGTDTYTVG